MSYKEYLEKIAGQLDTTLEDLCEETGINYEEVFGEDEKESDEKDISFLKDLYILKYQTKKLILNEVDLWNGCPDEIIKLIAKLHCELEFFFKDFDIFKMV